MRSCVCRAPHGCNPCRRPTRRASIFPMGQNSGSATRIWRRARPTGRSPPSPGSTNTTRPWWTRPRNRAPRLPLSSRRRAVSLRSIPYGAHHMTAIPEKYLDLLKQKKAFANLATVMPDGSPQVTPVWFDYTGDAIRVNTARGRVKARNMKEGAPVALSIMDPDNPYRYIQVRGRVRRVTENGADAHIDSLAKKYIDQDKYPWRRPGETRVTYEIEPTAVQTMG